MTNIISFHGKQEIKDKYIARVKAHIEADRIVKGQYWENGKGCAIGCTIEGNDHKKYESELGLPEWFAYLEDTLFESMPNDKAMTFPLRILEAIPVGVNLDVVKWKFTAFILKRNIERVLLLDIEESLKEKVVNAIRKCLVLQENAIKTGKWDEYAAESAARSAESAARSAAWSAARSAAWSAARSAESAAWSVAWSAARSVESAARSAEYAIYADKLIDLLREAK